MPRTASALALLAFAAAAAADEEMRFVDRDGQPVVVRPEAPGSGRALLLHFWATWCPECVEDLAHLADAIAGCDRVRVVAVNAGDGAAEVESFVAQHAVRLPVLRDPQGEVWRRLAGVGLPTNVYWHAGRRASDLGPKSRERWEALLESIGCPADEPRPDSAAQRSDGG